MKINNMPMISVVVPVYGTEKYLRKCLDSILGQTYKNIELIIVNDGSKDNSESIIKEYLRNYDNIKYVRHKKNRGLFQARISGAEEATGEYIAFVDSDDYISCDFYRLLVRKALETDADMVVGNFYLEYEDGKREYFNLDPFHIEDINLTGDEVLKTYMNQEGLCYSWQLVWNKIYKKSLWNDGEQYFKDFSSRNPNLIMTEDIAFSSFFWTHAKKVSNIQSAAYFYCKHSGQSTDTVTQNKLVRHLKDTIAVFNFFEYMLKEVNRFDSFEENYNNWRKLYGRINYSNFKRLKLIDENAELLQRGLFLNDKMHGMTFEDDYFYSTKTTVGDAFKWFEDIKEAISDDRCKYVSFDIFDTAVVRPFWLPTDLFYLMNKYFMDLTNATSDIDFAQIRIESERICRRELSAVNSSFDDINIKEIYKAMNSHYYVSEDICQKLMEKEIELEIRFCTERKAGKELYQLALDLNKTIFFTSDMYLERDTIEKILENNGYCDYNKLFLSSEVRLGKWSGRLYKFILKEYEIDDPQTMLHIGDNWGSDVEMPRKFEIKSFHLDKPTNIFSNINGGIYAGEGFTQSFVNNSTGRDLNGGMWGFMGLRTMLALVANKFFDNPYVNFNKATDFNANPVYIGYYALGMHIWGVVTWLCEKLNNSNTETVHFVARDGYIVKLAYDLLKENHDLPKSNYLYLSRKALALADVLSPIDMYSLINKLNIKNTSPKKFLNMFKDMIPDEKYNEIVNSFFENGFFANEKFANREDYERFIYFFLNNVWNDIDFSKYRDNLKRYFKDIIHENDVLFDIGYSGRSESALHSVLGFAINSYYIHSNSEVLEKRKKDKKFNNELFYYYKPYITGVMREHMFMKLAPSTIGYKENNGNMEPVFENYTIDSITKYITEVVQTSAISFIKDLINIFGEYTEFLYARKEDVSQPFEYYLNYGKKLDRNIFSTLIFEDDFGEGKKLRAVDFWSEEIERALKLQKAIDFKNRVIDKSEYIGAEKIEYYEEKGTKFFNELERAAIFLDPIEEKDDKETKYSKCAGNTGNIIDWSAIRETINPFAIPNYFSKNPGGFEADKFNVFITTNLIWLEENADITYLDDVLKRIGDKILLPIAIGFSSPDDKPSFRLSNSSIKTLSAIAERCNSVGAKGDYTAEILNKFGIKNVDVIGSPAMYNNFEKLKKLKSITNASGITASFKPFYGKLSIREKKLLSYMMDNGCKLIDTTKLELSKQHLGDDKLYSRLKGWEQKKDIYFDINDWKAGFKDIDFAFGMNFNNNALAMQCGIPALFINYESTGRELCRFFNLPNIDISEFDDKKSIENYCEKADVSEFVNTIDENYKKYNSFLKKNGVEIVELGNRIIEK